MIEVETLERAEFETILVANGVTPKKKLDIDACIWCFNEYKNTGLVPAGHFKFYQILMDFGLIKWTKEEKQAISGPIKEQYVKEIEQDRKRGRITKLNHTDIMSSLETNPTLISRVRKAALKKYFDSYATIEITKEELLKVIRNKMSNV